MSKPVSASDNKPVNDQDDKDMMFNSPQEKKINSLKKQMEVTKELTKDSKYHGYNPLFRSRMLIQKLENKIKHKKHEDSSNKDENKSSPKIR